MEYTGVNCDGVLDAVPGDTWVVVIYPSVTCKRSIATSVICGVGRKVPDT